MDYTDRPKLSPSDNKSIESAQIRIDEHYWKRLVNLQVSASTAGVVHLSFPDLKPKPPEPKRPNALRSVIARYAYNLFVVEAARYPTDNHLEHFLTELGNRTTERVVHNIISIEEAGQAPFRRASLEYHGLSLEHMREIANEEIESLINGRLEQIRPPLTPADHVESARTNHTILESTEPTTEIERRAKLLADYKAATGNPPHKKIYESSNAGIYKQDFYWWINGKLHAKSKVTKRFEAFLKARRRPIPRKPSS